MKTLDALLNGLKIPVLSAGPPDIQVDRVTDNSKEAGPGVLFVAIAGAKADGHTFLSDAAQRGTRVALVAHADVPAPPGMTLVPIENPRRALALIAESLVGNPSREMQVIAVTGTNGKTTTTYLLESIFRAHSWRA